MHVCVQARANRRCGPSCSAWNNWRATQRRCGTSPNRHPEGSNRLLTRLDQNEDILRAFNRASLAVNPSRLITPAAEWFLDNFYLIEEQIQMARRHLPRGYSRELPRLSNGTSSGLPRVYDIVLELISHADAQIDAEPLSAFVAAYQTVSSLKLGELWAIPIMLRLGLIENLRRITTRLTVGREDRDLADLWVDRLQDMAEKAPSQLVVVVADMAKSDLSLSSAFVAEFCQRLSLRTPVLHLARGWLEQKLVEQGSSIEQLVQLESQSQAADQVSVSHSIASLRFLSAMDWKEFVEKLSLVEEILRSDPAGVYPKMDFSTRDRYRHSVEFLARHSQLSEADVARRAIQLATDSARQEGSERPDGPCGLLLDRQRPNCAWAHDEGTVALANHHRTKHPPLSADVLCGRHRCNHIAGHMRADAADPDARSASMETRFLRPGFPPLCQPTGCGLDELAVHAAGQTQPAPAPGFFLRHRRGLRHDGGGSHNAHEPGRSGSSHRDIGNSSSRESGSAPSLRSADGFSRRAGGEFCREIKRCSSGRGPESRC